MKIQVPFLFFVLFFVRCCAGWLAGVGWSGTAPGGEQAVYHARRVGATGNFWKGKQLLIYHKYCAKLGSLHSHLGRVS